MALYGVDVSHWQGNIDFESFSKDRNGQFLIAKASEGKTVRDNKFERNMKLCEQYGILRGAYHYVRGDSAWYEQTNNFLSQVQRFDRDVLYALDVEDRTLVEKGASFTKELVSDMVHEIYDQTHIYPLIYVSLGFLNPRLFMYDNMHLKCGGWIAAWGSSVRNKPKRADLNTSIWQHTSKGTVSGIKGAVDLDIAYMSKESWLKFANPERRR